MVGCLQPDLLFVRGVGVSSSDDSLDLKLSDTDQSVGASD